MARTTFDYPSKCHLDQVAFHTELLHEFVRKEFGPNLKPGYQFSQKDAIDLATLYPEIWAEYNPITYH